MQPLEGYQVESEAGRAVALALDLDDELIREGLAREIVRAVQNARKESRPARSPTGSSSHLGGDGELLAAARAHESYVAGETLASRITYAEDGLDGAGSVAIERPRADDRAAPRRTERRRDDELRARQRHEGGPRRRRADLPLGAAARRLEVPADGDLAEALAHPYVDIAHRAALLYSFATLLLAVFVEL